MCEVLNRYREQIDGSNVLGELSLTERGYLLVSMHREENVDYATPLKNLLTALEQLAKKYECPVIVSTHPRTRKRMENLGYEVKDDRIRFLKPFGFHDYNRLQKSAKCVISDSGTISEESSMLKFPAVTIRNALERPEAMDSGSITIASTEPDRIMDCVEVVVDQFEAGNFATPPAEYQVDNCSQRVIQLILGTAKLAHRWQGIDSTEEKI